MDYNIERSSSTDIKNIKWTQKNTTDHQNPKKKKKKQTSPTNIISSKNTKTPKTFKIEDKINISKKKKTLKKAQSSSLDNCKIEQGYKRKAR